MRIVPILVVTILISTTFVQGRTSPQQCQEINTSVAALSRRTGDEEKVLARLFNLGDDCIGDLISLLNGSDFDISVAAQQGLRYLGNEKGLSALAAWNKKNKKTYPVWGPVPVPIMDFDYELIELNLLNDGQRDLGLVVSSHIFALAIDNSPKSKNLFKEVVQKYESKTDSVNKRIVARLHQNYPLRPFAGTSATVANDVLQNAFFLSEEDRKFTTARLLSFNGKKDKALVELHMSRGLMAEEWYHVVVSRTGTVWQFYSITFIKQS